MAKWTWTEEHAEKAFRIWDVIAEAAKRGDPPLTYGDVYKETDIHYRGEQDYPLGIIQRYCAKNELPPLTALVVDQKRREPSGGYHGDLETITEDQQRVYNHPDWTNPGLATFRAMTGTYDE